MLKRTLAALIVALTAFCGGTAQAEPLKLTFSTGSVGGGFFAVGSGIAGFASQKIPGISITAISAAGVVESINRLEQGKADFAMLNTQDPPLAWEGKAPYKKQYRNMRGMGILYMQAAQPYTLKSSGIRTFKDLKGKTLSVGAPGGTMHLDFFRWVEANGLDPKKDFGKVLPARQRSHGSGQDRTGGRRRGTVVHPLAADLRTLHPASRAHPRIPAGSTRRHDAEVPPIPAYHHRKGSLQRHRPAHRNRGHGRHVRLPGRPAGRPCL